MKGTFHMGIEFSVEKRYMKRLMRLLATTEVEVVRNALTLLNWAADETSKNRFIISSDNDGKKPQRLALPVLESIRQRNKKPSHKA